MIPGGELSFSFSQLLAAQIVLLSTQGIVVLLGDFLTHWTGRARGRISYIEIPRMSLCLGYSVIIQCPVLPYTVEQPNTVHIILFIVLWEVINETISPYRASRRLFDEMCSIKEVSQAPAEALQCNKMYLRRTYCLFSRKGSTMESQIQTWIPKGPVVFVWSTWRD